MALTRRQFLTLMGGSTVGAVVFQACGIPPDELLVESPVEMPEDMVTGLDNWYTTLCRQCPTSEGLVVRVMEGRAKKVEGNVDYPINLGKHSARCEAALQSLYHPDRISGPLVRVGERGARQWEEISWADALGRLTFQLKNLQDEGRQGTMRMVTGPMGSRLGMGMVVRSFASRFGAQHVTLEPPERANLRAAARSVFGHDALPDFDLENTSYLLSFGADFLNTWGSPVRYARGYGEFRQGERERGTLVHVDSRFSMTGANADEWIFVNPGWEGVLALSIAQVIISEGMGDSGAADALTGGGEVDLSRYEPERVAGQTGVSAERIRRIAAEFADHRPSLAIGGGSAAAHTSGLANLTAIYSLNYLVGSVGRPGGVILNPAPDIDGIPEAPSSFGDWQRLVSDMDGGEVRVLMVHGADPFYALPASSGFRDASYNVPFIFALATHLDDTAAMADLVLPVHDPLEEWGSDVPDPGPGYRLVGFQQPVVRPFFESRGIHLGTRSFADVILATAQGLELDLEVNGETIMEVLQDGARRIFEAGAGVVGTTRVSDIPDFRTFWNTALRHGFWRDEAATYDGAAPTPPRLPPTPPEPKFSGAEGSYPFALIPFASASLTDGRGAHLPWLQATPDPITTATWLTWVEINMRVAEEMGIKEGDVINVRSPHGSIEALAYPHPGGPTGVVSIPMGQGHAAGGRYAEGRGSNVLSILSPLKDSETGALAWAATRVRIEKTGRSSTLPRFENSAPDLAVDEERLIIPLTQHDT